MSPARVTLDIGPQEPDATEGFGQIGAGTQAKTLLLRHAALHPPELMEIFAGPHIPLAGEAVDLEEVARVAKPEGEVEGARVFGDERRDPSTWVVGYLFRGESGRSGRGVVSYDKLTDSRSEWERRQAARLRGRTETARAEGDSAEFDPDRVSELEAELERTRGELQRLQDPEPYEGYDDATADDIKREIREADLSDPEKYLLVQSIVEYEPRHKDRDSVTDAARKAVEDEDERRKEAEAAAAAAPAPGE